VRPGSLALADGVLRCRFRGQGRLPALAEWSKQPRKERFNRVVMERVGEP